jgi:hypothetical protein
MHQSKRVIQALIDKGYLECRKIKFWSIQPIYSHHPQ